MEIIKFDEEKDGSCIMECNFSEEEIKTLVSFAINKLLKEHIKELEEKV